MEDQAVCKMSIDFIHRGNLIDMTYLVVILSYCFIVALLFLIGYCLLLSFVYTIKGDDIGAIFVFVIGALFCAAFGLHLYWYVGVNSKVLDCSRTTQLALSFITMYVLTMYFIFSDEPGWFTALIASATLVELVLIIVFGLYQRRLLEVCVAQASHILTGYN